MSDLISRLRDTSDRQRQFWHHADVAPCSGLLDEAADRIDELEARLALVAASAGAVTNHFRRHSRRELLGEAIEALDAALSPPRDAQAEQEKP